MNVTTFVRLLVNTANADKKKNDTVKYIDLEYYNVTRKSLLF